MIVVVGSASPLSLFARFLPLLAVLGKTFLLHRNALGIEVAYLALRQVGF